MDLEHMSWRMFVIRLVEIVVIVNIALLDILSFQSFPHYTANVATVRNTPTIPPATPSPAITPVAAAQTVNQTTINQVSGVKELFIPLGSGQLYASDWTNVSGVQATIDSTKYTNIKTIVFETSIHVPTSNEIVSVRLFDVTNGHPVWYSEMTMSGASQFLVSQPIQLDNGDNVYQVQMKTQLQYPAVLDQARLHMTLN